MTQDPNSEANFTVHAGETVTISVAASKTACLTHAAFDGTVLARSSSNPDVYSFTVAGTPGDEPRLACVCHFDQADPPDANYTTTVTSDDGSGPFFVDGVFKEAPEAAFMLFFLIN